MRSANLSAGKFVTHFGLLLIANKPWTAVRLTATNTSPTTTIAAMSLRRALAPRSVHVRIVPRPANLSESREIYRVLQKFGDMDVFKYLRVCDLDALLCED